MLRRGSNALLLLQQLARRRASAAGSDAPALAAAASLGPDSSSSTRAHVICSPTTLARDDDSRPPLRLLRDGAPPIGVGVGVGVGSARAASRAFRSSAAPRVFTMPSPTQLDAVMRVETLVDRTPDEIEDIWMAYHGGDPAAAAAEAAAAAAAAASGRGGDGGAAAAAASSPPPPPAGEHCVGTVLSAEEYKAMSARAKASPMFVLPLRKTVVRRRKQAGGDEAAAPAGAADAPDAPDAPAAAPAAAGPSSPSSPSSSATPAYLTLLLQWQLPLLLVTTVDEYRRLGPSAPPHLVATFYPQLADSKGVVLARADMTGRGGGGGAAVASRAEARTVLELARAFYADGDMHRMAYAFNHDQGAFDFAQLLRALGLEGAAPVEAAAEEEVRQQDKTK